MKSEKAGSLLGGTLLIGGSCVGAGMLGLPIITGLTGFFPSIIMLLVAWAFMTITALLLLEANGWFEKDANMLTMVGHSLGKWGRGLSWILYIFLFYSLLVAYQAGIGIDVSSAAFRFLNWSISPWVGTIGLIIIFGCILYSGTKPTDIINRFLMAGKILSYLGIVIVGISHITPQLLTYFNQHYLLQTIPILIISFGFHNMIPTITSYMQGDIRRVRLSIIFGSLFALVVYLLWNLIVLGTVPVEGEVGIKTYFGMGKDASQALVGILGANIITHFADALAFFSLLTSLLLQSLALVHFLSDGLHTKDKEPLILILLVLIPPFLLSLYRPDIFFHALNFAGGICAVVLFGILPTLMVWRGRYQKQTKGPYTVIGGKPLLIGVIAFAGFVFLYQLITMIYSQTT